MSSRAPLPTDAGRALHERLLAGADDPDAPSDFAVAYLDRLTDWLIARNPRADPDDCAAAAADAILALIKNPAAYQPERQTLEVYLRISAAGDLKNLLRAERRHSRRRAALESVELSPAVGKYLWDAEGDPALIVERREGEGASPAEAYPVPPAVLEGLTAEERRVLDLMRLGERKTAAYALALGIADRPAAEQRREVKRVKDRLQKRLERAGDKGGRHE